MTSGGAGGSGVGRGGGNGHISPPGSLRGGVTGLQGGGGNFFGMFSKKRVEF